MDKEMCSEERARTMLEVLGKMVEIIKGVWPDATEVTSTTAAGIAALHMTALARDGGTVDMSIVVVRR